MIWSQATLSPWIWHFDNTAIDHLFQWQEKKYFKTWHNRQAESIPNSTRNQRIQWKVLNCPLELFLYCYCIYNQCQYITGNNETNQSAERPGNQLFSKYKLLISSSVNANKHEIHNFFYSFILFLMPGFNVISVL